MFNSKYAHSIDGLRWNVLPTDPYRYMVKHEDGSERVFIRCERPQLLFSNNSEAIYLFNGVQPKASHSYTIALLPLVKIMRKLTFEFKFAISRVNYVYCM